MSSDRVKRHLIGAISLLLLITGIVLLTSGPDDNGTKTVAAACLRVGAVLAAGWLAFRQVSVLLARVPAWMMGLLALGVLTIVARPKTALFIVPGMIVLWFLRPRGPKSGQPAAGRAGTGAGRRRTAKKRSPTRGGR